MPRVDYDQIAHLYDEPIRDHAADDGLLTFLARRPDLGPESIQVLDIGCGTGKQLAANRERFPSSILVGIDRYRGMLGIARRRGPDVTWVQGDGCRLPLRDSSFDYVTSQFAYQHVGEPERFIREVSRVVRPAGRFVMTNIDPWSMPSWAIYQHFPEARTRDFEDFLPVAQFMEIMDAAGFVDVRVERRLVTRTDTLQGCLEYASERHRTSQLMAIPDATYEAGLERLRQAIAAAGTDVPRIESEVCLVTIACDAPGWSGLSRTDYPAGGRLAHDRRHRDR